MAIRILTKNAVDNTNIDGARDFNFNSGRRSGIVKGALNEGNFFASSSNIIAFDTCELRLCGHRIVVDATEYKSLVNKPSVPIRYALIAEVIVNDDNDVSFNLFVQYSSTTLVQDNLDINGKGKFQLEIGKFTLLTDGTITDVIRTADLITGSGTSDYNYIRIGDVKTNKISPELDADVDIENVIDETDNKPKTNFTFNLPTQVGTVVSLDGEEQTSINTDLTPKENSNNLITSGGIYYPVTFAESERLKTLNLFNIHNPNNHNYNCSTEFLTSNELKVTQTTGTYGHISILCLNLNEYLGKTLYLSCDAEKSSSSTNTGMLFAYRTNYSTITDAESLGGVDISTTGHYTYSFTVPSTPYSEPNNYLSVYLYSDRDTGTTGDYIIYSNVMVSLDGNASYQSYNGNITYQNNVYPIGSIYMSVNEASPASFFGGTWERLKDRFLLGAGDTYTAGATGGDASHSHTLNNGRAMIGERAYDPQILAMVKSGQKDYVTGWYEIRTTNSGQDATFDGWDVESTKLAGSTDQSSNMPPYLCVYMWKRIA